MTSDVLSTNSSSARLNNSVLRTTLLECHFYCFCATVNLFLTFFPLNSILAKKTAIVPIILIARVRVLPFPLEDLVTRHYRGTFWWTDSHPRHTNTSAVKWKVSHLFSCSAKQYLQNAKIVLLFLWTCIEVRYWWAVVIICSSTIKQKGVVKNSPRNWATLLVWRRWCSPYKAVQWLKNNFSAFKAVFFHGETAQVRFQWVRKTTISKLIRVIVWCNGQSIPLAIIFGRFWRGQSQKVLRTALALVTTRGFCFAQFCSLCGISIAICGHQNSLVVVS